MGSGISLRWGFGMVGLAGGVTEVLNRNVSAPRSSLPASVKLSGRKIRFSGLFSVSGPHRKIIFQQCSSVFRHCSSDFPGFFRFRSNPENSFPPESLTLGPPRRCFCACPTASLRVPAGQLHPAALRPATSAPPRRPRRRARLARFGHREGGLRTPATPLRPPRPPYSGRVGRPCCHAGLRVQAARLC